MHAVEGRGFRRLGGTEVLQSTFRLICATNRAPGKLAQGLLEADFCDRIAVFPLTVPNRPHDQRARPASSLQMRVARESIVRRRREPERGVLHRVLLAHLGTFDERTRPPNSGRGPPRFV